MMVRDLAAAVLWPVWLGLRPSYDKDVIASAFDHVFAVLGPQRSYEVLGIIAPVLSAVAGGIPLSSRAAPFEALTPRGGVVNLTSFIRSLPAGEQQYLKAKAGGWGSILARAVGEAVDAEEAIRRRAVARPEQARRDAAWVRHATLQYASDARRRVAARAARREAGNVGLQR